MTLKPSSLEWAIDFIATHSDGDLFPRVAEMSAIRARKAEFSSEVTGIGLGKISPGAHRRFIVPKDEISYRQATQLHPQDSILLSAIAYEHGSGIERRRRPALEVFSYRFSPTAQHGLYSSQSAWNQFWTQAVRLSGTANTILYCDIADFYNQISHHTVENQLIESAFPNPAIRWIVSLLESTTAGVSRGVPIGPHAAHLIAEASMIPIDNSMAASGLQFLRYADDIVIFAQSERQARQSLARVAQILDKQQRLQLQRHKTKFFDVSSFSIYCSSMIEDRPINDKEDRLLKLVKKYSKGDPYAIISYNEISEEDWKKIDRSVVSEIILEYINRKEVDFIRLRWFYRRLSQIGHPGALDVTVDNLEMLTPCFASICTYIASIQRISKAEWESVGSRLLAALYTEEICSSEYFRLSLLSLFSRNSEINHFNSLAPMYAGSDAFAKREITLAAKASGAIDWLREFKEDFDGMDPWQKIAYIFCSSKFPRDERKYFLNRLSLGRPFERQLIQWAKQE